MIRIRFKLMHLLILMATICVAIPSYIAYKKYDHRRKVERYTVVKKLLHEEFTEYASSFDGPQRAGRYTVEEMVRSGAQHFEKQEYLKALQQEASDLSLELNY